jgi:ethanolamine ammonia-lyase large subunit
MGKLTGVSMGVDVCYTNHMKADQDDMDNLAVLLTQAGVNFLITVPHADDVMLNYQSMGYHEAQTLRTLHQLDPIKEFNEWLIENDILDGNRKLTKNAGDASVFLK